MNLTKLTDQELAERYHPWAVELIKKRGREPTGIDSLRHHANYMMVNGNAADIDDLQVLARLFHLAVDELIADAPPCSMMAPGLKCLRSMERISRLRAGVPRT